MGPMMAGGMTTMGAEGLPRFTKAVWPFFMPIKILAGSTPSTERMSEVIPGKEIWVKEGGAEVLGEYKRVPWLPTATI